ncbi:MAG: efflux transporter outer membrane subunit [Deltaproteobacteria bacterium]|nr:efflux transporter outer membrane subunit [Deltaproteobacteria bacterium]
MQNFIPTQKIILKLFVLALAANLGACLAPRYIRPTVETAPAFKEQATPEEAKQWKMAIPSDLLACGPWWELFGDAQLNELEQKIASGNQNVKQAEARYRQARALVSGARAVFLPTVTIQPALNRKNTGGDMSHSFDLSGTASWESNVWETASAFKGAKARAQSSAAQLEGMKLSMQAELATDFFSLQELDMEIGLLNSSVTYYQEALKLNQIRLQGGISSELEVAQAQTQLESTRAQATDLGIARAQFEHALAVLIGESPSTFSLPLSQIQREPPSIPAGLPSQLLERRPDIASAERLVMAANAQIGQARAAYFPALSLTSSRGYTGLLSSPLSFWSIGASAVETLLDFGRRRAGVRQAHATYEESVAFYRQTVLNAFKEVEDNLAALRLLSQEIAQQNSAVKAAEKSLQIESARLKAGTVSNLDVIVEENILLTNKRNAVQLIGRRMNLTVALIRALGGGWESFRLP